MIGISNIFRAIIKLINLSSPSVEERAETKEINGISVDTRCLPTCLSPFPILEINRSVCIIFSNNDPSLLRLLIISVGIRYFVNRF